MWVGNKRSIWWEVSSGVYYHKHDHHNFIIRPKKIFFKYLKNPKRFVLQTFAKKKKKNLSALLFFFFRKWAMPNAGIFFFFFFIVFLAHFFFFFFFFLLLCGQCFFYFFLATKKKSQKLGSVCRAIRQKWVHILIHKPFFFLGLTLSIDGMTLCNITMAEASTAQW